MSSEAVGQVRSMTRIERRARRYVHEHSSLTGGATDRLKANLTEALHYLHPGLPQRDIETELAWIIGRGRIFVRGDGEICWIDTPLGLLLKDRLAEAQNWRCCWCGSVMNHSVRYEALTPTFEHIVPRSEGGSESLSNLAISCRGCNSGRAAPNQTYSAMVAT